MPSCEKSGVMGAQRRPSPGIGVREGFLEEATLELALKDKKTLARQRKSKRVMQREQYVQRPRGGEIAYHIVLQTVCDRGGGMG